MKVKDLINTLQEQDPEMEVFVATSPRQTGGYSPISEQPAHKMYVTNMYGSYMVNHKDHVKLSESGLYDLEDYFPVLMIFPAEKES